MNIYKILFITFSLLFWNFSLSAQNLEYLVYHERSPVTNNNVKPSQSSSQNNDEGNPQSADTPTANDIVSELSDELKAFLKGLAIPESNGLKAFLNGLSIPESDELKAFLNGLSIPEADELKAFLNDLLADLPSIFSESDNQSDFFPHEDYTDPKNFRELEKHRITPIVHHNDDKTVLMLTKIVQSGIEPTIFINWLFERKRINSELERQGTSLRTLEEKAEIYTSITPTIDKEAVIAFMLIRRGIDPSIFQEASPEQTAYLIDSIGTDRLLK